MKSTERFEYKEDYVQSANTLFHFMKEEQYLVNAIQKCALMPRYCLENIEYMKLMGPEEKAISQMAVLQKCFCDIPFHKIGEKSPIDVINEDGLSEDVKKSISKLPYSTHTDFYGEYGIGFSKSWCVEKGLQPVLYVNESSDYLSQLKEYFSFVMNKQDIDDVVVADILRQFAYIKPLKGTMRRVIAGANVECKKNFHDEKEWRYIPVDALLSEMQVNKVIFNEKIMEEYIHISDNLEAPSFSKLWLQFTYEDIKYLIVPDRYSRENVIKCILELPKEGFVSDFQRYELISKIQVLDDIRKDW